ncbi:MAG TPA: adenine-specific methyltransferase EcoRI family protein [Acidimicrobiales bacterium]|nr:adenine-specific methyltransferase EcoRI family protein [Acidimicrobiales bacterium]
MANDNLSSAKSAKNDEFYTQYSDIEKEMNAYLEFDSDAFRDKTVLLPCDDPEWSNFTKYFAQNFERMGLRKLISTSYAPTAAAHRMQPTLFESQSPQFDAVKTVSNGKIFTLQRDSTGDQRIDVDDLEWDYLDGDGDFRSDEICRLRDESDVVITNPPFSLFREFLTWIMEAKKQFVIIGSMNAITYKEVFPVIMIEEMWLGNGFQAGNAYFRPLTEREYAAGVYDETAKLVKFRNVVWFTNLDHGRRHQPLALMTQADNKKFSKHKEIKGVGYTKYDNYDAIEVPYTDAIPSDYPGVMGVPISYLSKHNPEQFEILGTEKDWEAGRTKTYSQQVQVTASGVRSNVMKLNDGAALRLPGPPTGETYYEVDGKVFTQVYKRLFIRHRKAAE